MKKNGAEKYLCKCRCGTNKYVRKQHLLNHSSGGCNRCNDSRKTHGESNTPLHRVWNKMRYRCLDPKDTNYYNYGGRGITVSKDWLIYENFRDWCLSNNWEQGLEIDRIDVNGNYCPENCRLATRQQNNYNKRPRKNNKRTSIFKGVYLSKGRWVARINKEGKAYHIGTFDTEIDAAISYNQKAYELFEQYAFINKIKCFIDMDGTLCCFFEKCLEILGYSEVPPELDGNIPWNFLQKLGVDEEQFWSSLDRTFWESLDKTSWADKLIEACEKRFGIEQICILSAAPTTNSGEAYVGKISWLETHYPELANRFILGYCKYFCSSPEAVLIDDGSHNIKAFKEHGGSAILVPGKWNELWQKDPWEHLKKELDKI